MQKNKTEKRLRIHKKIRSKISGTESRPRLCVFRSSEHIYAQIINDDTATTICTANDLGAKKGQKLESAKKIGQDIANKAKANNISVVVFDRGGFPFKGRIAALANAAREAGLQF
jgi:large subunit ribosomal protein L18